VSRIRTGHTPDAWKELGPAHVTVSSRISGSAIRSSSASERARMAKIRELAEFPKVKSVSDDEPDGTLEA